MTHQSKTDRKQARYEQFFTEHKKVVRIVTILGLAVTAVIFYLLLKHDLLNNPVYYRQKLLKYGPWAPVIFFIVTVFNAIYPIIQGGMGNVVAYSVFGPLKGFLLAFSANLLGSLLLFLLAKKFGKAFLLAFVSKETIDKYIGYIDNEKKLSWLLAVAFVIPGLPDDAFAMLAGLSSMTVGKYMTLQLLFKPVTTFLYMSGVNKGLAFLTRLFQSLG